MATETGEKQHPPGGTPALPSEGLTALACEIAVYRREIPRLVEEGHAGRYALIKDDQILSIWDTQRDALQAARERFGLEPVAVKKIDPRDLDRLPLLDAQTQSPCRT